ncbi:RCC1 domain-containing protein [Aspergillus undulatus]|uniref:RCC1 domain-containing protein n=1 Tax=Aspergillus undulatus TaxID=1810928 RepID=UPI003CCDB077
MNPSPQIRFPPPPPIPSLYALGSNGSGQLGLGHDEDVSVPGRCLFEPEPESESESESQDPSSSTFQSQAQRHASVSRIVAGGNHTLLLLSDGRVYAAGEDGDGRCGGGSSNPGGDRAGKRFKRVILTHRPRFLRDSYDGATKTKTKIGLFKGVSATWEASFLVTSDTNGKQNGQGVDGGDKIFVLGSGSKGELGLGFGMIEAYMQQIPNFPPSGNSLKVVSIASGMSHTVVILSDGRVWGWGASRKGQLGREHVNDKILWNPKRISVPAGFRATDVVCGREFTVLSGYPEKGEILIYGSEPGLGSRNGLGDKWGIHTSLPNPDLIQGYKKTHAAWHGIYVHQADSTILSWGRNDRGQLPPAELNGVRVRDIAVGSEHGLALLDDGSVVAFGWGEHGNCGRETDEKGDVKGPEYKRIEFPEGSRVVGLGAGCATSWIVAR